MRTRRRLLTVCTAVAAVALGIVNPASAGELSNLDPSEDVRHYDLSEGTEGALPGTVMPAHSNGDLRRYSVRYGENRIRVALKFRELTRAEPVLMIQSRFRWPAGGQLDYAEAVITATDANRSGTARMTTRPCKVRHRISYRNNRARLSFPARCFSSPRWVQFNAWVLTMDHKADPTYMYGDHVFPVISNEENAVERFTRRIPHP